MAESTPYTRSPTHTASTCFGTCLLAHFVKGKIKQNLIGSCPPGPLPRCAIPFASCGWRHLLLQVLQDAAVAKVVDVAAEEHQVRVDVGGHAAVGRDGVLGRGRHHGGTLRETLPTALHQGTKSEKGGFEETIHATGR